jgi:hypothetical protein
VGVQQLLRAVRALHVAGRRKVRARRRSPVPPRQARAPDSVNYSGAALGGIPLTKPPYASLVGRDLNKGEIAWKVPFGEGSPRSGSILY